MNSHTDAAFLTEVLQFATELQKATGYKVDTIHAARMLPESDPAMMTWIVRQAFAP